MKKFIQALLLAPALFVATALKAGDPANVDAYLLKAFASAYPSAEKISWTEEHGHFVVHFLDHDVRSVMEYDADAKVVQSFRYYTDPALLPQNIRWEFKRRFPDKTLYGVTEINEGENTAWFLKGQDSKQWITIRATADGELQVVEKMKKQM